MLVDYITLHGKGNIKTKIYFTNLENVLEKGLYTTLITGLRKKVSLKPYSCETFINISEKKVVMNDRVEVKQESSVIQVSF